VYCTNPLAKIGTRVIVVTALVDRYKVEPKII
jgi:hypothetical protein